jgi:hypothetical protein
MRSSSFRGIRYPIESDVVVVRLVSRRSGRVVCPSRANNFSFVPFRCTGGDFVLLRFVRQGSGGELIGRRKGEGEFGSDGRRGRDGMVWCLGDEQGFEDPPTQRMDLPWRAERESVMSGSRG